MKFQPSLKRLRRILAELADTKFVSIDQTKLTYTDMRRNMKIMLKFPAQHRYVLQIHTENEIANTLSRLDCEYERFDEIYPCDGNICL